jgi:F-type H+-transporting ATPase subunit epsilon
MRMRLTVMLPEKILLENEVSKVVAEAADGSFGILPRHIDMVAALVPGLMSYEDSEGEEEFLAVDGGVLVKQGEQILVSTRNAVRGPDLGTLRQTVRERFQNLDELEKKAQSAMARLEADVARGFLELQE